MQESRDNFFDELKQESTIRERKRLKREEKGKRKEEEKVIAYIKNKQNWLYVLEKDEYELIESYHVQLPPDGEAMFSLLREHCNKEVVAYCFWCLAGDHPKPLVYCTCKKKRWFKFKE
jgi:hypothetical protein